MKYTHFKDIKEINGIKIYRLIKLHYLLLFLWDVLVVTSTFLLFFCSYFLWCKARLCFCVFACIGKLNIWQEDPEATLKLMTYLKYLNSYFTLRCLANCYRSLSGSGLYEENTHTHSFLMILELKNTWLSQKCLRNSVWKDERGKVCAGQ